MNILAPFRARLLVTFIGLVYSLIGYVTLTYPQDFLYASQFWASAMLLGGALALAFSARPGQLLAKASGTLIVSTSIARGLAIDYTLGFGAAVRVLTRNANLDALESSFFIAGLTWVLIGAMIWLGWPFLTHLVLERERYE